MFAWYSSYYCESKKAKTCMVIRTKIVADAGFLYIRHADVNVDFLV